MNKDYLIRLAEKYNTVDFIKNDPKLLLSNVSIKPEK